MESNRYLERGAAPAPKRSFRGVLLATAIGTSLVLSSVAPYAIAQDQGPNLTQQTQQQVPQLLPSLSPIIQKVMPAVVNVSVTMKGDAAMSSDDEEASPGSMPGGNGGIPNFPSSPFDEMLKRFFDQQGRGPGNGPGMPQRPQTGNRVALGSGFIIDPQGYVVTNNHVVGESGTVTVIFQDDTKHPAKIVGRDPKTDLALLKIETSKPLPFVAWGDSDAAKIGDWILAIGNPFGLGGTVTTGIISARGRDIHSGPFDDYLQLDAPINRGNSGGPTFNQQGQVIGINTAIYSPNGGSVGIGFAIPASLAKPVIEQIKAHGKVERGWLGVQIQEVTPEIAQSLGLAKPAGALVADVTGGGPAAKAGLKQGDVVLSFNGHDITKVRDLPLVVAQTPVGQKAKLEVLRNGQKTALDVGIGQMPNDKQQASAAGEQEEEQATPANAMGMHFAPLDNQLRQELHIGKDVQGVAI